MQRIDTEFAGRKLSMETGRLARQAAGSVLMQFGETTLLVAVTVSTKQSHLPFFPLTVEYREKFYAAGKIPGGYIKREARPSDDEILSCRLIDRTIRPLFPENFRNEVQVFVTVLATDQENDADVLAITATSAALKLSGLPWGGPVAAVRVGKIEGRWILNPTYEQLEFSTMDIVVSGSKDSIMMVEGGALQISEAEILEAFKVAQKGIRELIALEEQLIKGVEVTPITYTPLPSDESLKARVKDVAAKDMSKAINAKDKAGRAGGVAAAKSEAQAKLAVEFPDRAGEINAALDEVEYYVMREQVLTKGERVDGRDLDTVRPITIEAGFLPKRVHGSALFTRGETQALVAVTLGTGEDEQRINTIDQPGDHHKSFMLHYNFPPFCTGEAKPIRGTSRREIGHGNLAERALHSLLPQFEQFPYTIRVVSEILESNGSSSMASVCGGSLALMDAGVPMVAPCAGVAMGLVLEGKRSAILTDILGSEDALGDMDFKVAGTEAGITSIQMDIKIEGITIEIMQAALEKAYKGRMHILAEMKKVLSTAREDLSPYAPRIFTIQIKTDKIGDLIGPKGKTIRGIEETTGAKVTVDDTGLVTIAAVGADAMAKAKAIVTGITSEPEIGTVYEGAVKSTTAFGAFVEIMPGVEGLLHISELQHARTEKTEDVVKKGDIVTVKLIEVDERGRMRLSRKALMPKE